MPPLFFAGLAINLAGLTAALYGWIRYRHPGQAFWVVAPLWHAPRYLQPTGVRLWAGGVGFSLVGATAMWAELLKPLYA